MERREFGLRVAMGLPLLAGPAKAGEFWNDKAPADWNDKEVKKLLSRSPWVKGAVVEFDPGRMGGGMGGPGMGGGRRGGGGMGGGEMGGGMPGGGMGGPGGGGGGMGGPGMGGGGGMGGGMPGGGMGPGGGGFEPPKITVRWESEPVREGEIKAEAKYAGMLAEAAKDHYVIAAQGGGLGRRGGGEGPGGLGGFPGGGSDPRQREQVRQQWEARMKSTTTLAAKGKEPVPCVKIARAETGDGFLTFFLFPRSPGFSLDDKEVTFHTVLGPMEVKAKFALKDMIYKGQLAL
ncbi:MAG: hypothetical protein IT161_13290 [Bryobacterales bacterium]|nr:hypothetical protein [Bryobacterales bacterium]